LALSHGAIGLMATSARPPSGPLRRTGVLLVVAAPFAAGALTFLLRAPCPVYVSGDDAGFCNYEQVDVLGGWLSGVIVATYLMRSSWPVVGDLGEAGGRGSHRTTGFDVRDWSEPPRSVHDIP
jgi:hypothetical protein